MRLRILKVKVKINRGRVFTLEYISQNWSLLSSPEGQSTRNPSYQFWNKTPSGHIHNVSKLRVYPPRWTPGPAASLSAGTACPLQTASSYCSILPWLVCWLCWCLLSHSEVRTFTWCAGITTAELRCSLVHDNHATTGQSEASVLTNQSPPFRVLTNERSSPCVVRCQCQCPGPYSTVWAQPGHHYTCECEGQPCAECGVCQVCAICQKRFIIRILSNLLLVI